MSVSIRRMELSDLKTVVRVESQIFKDAWPQKSFEQDIENIKISYPCVLIRDSIILGYATAWHYAGEVHIGNIAVIPEERGRGYATMMLVHILDKYADHKTAYLEVRSSNTPAIKLYKKLNFKELAIRQAYYSDGEDAAIMYKSLQ